ncbi:putative protein kinase RLK-Pelle-CrRLK1L-1 family [Helianthus annuus]|nr:putative protein kinase RLK-Pelle-CrRLK1L-1 family [Helianthus annuus]
MFYYRINTKFVCLSSLISSRLEHNHENHGIDPETRTYIQPCCYFQFSEIWIATENFDESLVIGSGGFGKVYKGNVVIGATHVVVAIKRLDSLSDQGATEFWAEMILVYEYVPNGTLDDHLHKFNTPLSWLQRLNICIGACRGIHYLRTGTGVHWTCKISDFGLSKACPTDQPSTHVSTRIKGTFGYLDPNYYATGRLTRKSDVYAFGVVLLEVLCRKRAVDIIDSDIKYYEEQWSLATWAQDSIKEGKLKDIIDSDIKGEISQKCMKEFVRVVERSLNNDPKQRPTMAEVVVSLESLRTLQEKFNNLMAHEGQTKLGRVIDMLPFPFNDENSGIYISFLSVYKYDLYLYVSFFAYICRNNVRTWKKKKHKRVQR